MNASNSCALLISTLGYFDAYFTRKMPGDAKPLHKIDPKGCMSLLNETPNRKTDARPILHQVEQTGKPVGDTDRRYNVIVSPSCATITSPPL